MKMPKPETQPVVEIAKPMMLVGGGRLIAPIWKKSNESSGSRYCFTVCRKSEVSSLSTGNLFPIDVLNLVRLAKALSDVMLEEGCLSTTERTILKLVQYELSKVGQSSDSWGT